MKIKNKIPILIIAIALAIIIFGLIIQKNGNSSNKNTTKEEKIVYNNKYDQYKRTIEFTFKDNKAKKAIIKEEYIDDNLMRMNIALLDSEGIYTDFKEKSNSVEYTYTKDGFKGLLNKTKAEIDSMMKEMKYKKRG